jgi:hypothetical protein
MVLMMTPLGVAAAMWKRQADAPALATQLRSVVMAKCYHVYK